MFKKTSQFLIYHRIEMLLLLQNCQTQDIVSIILFKINTYLHFLNKMYFNISKTMI